MRGEREKQPQLFIYRTPNDFVPEDHPLRKVKELVDAILVRLSPLFDKMYKQTGRPSTPPERLLKAQVLQALFTIRSERQLCEQIQYNLLFRWFLDMEMDEDAFDQTTFTKNRNRLLKHEVALVFFDAVVDLARDNGWASEDHFTVDGTLIEAWASMKSFRPTDEQTPPDPDDPGNPSVDFHGEKRTNQTHRSTTDPDARLAKKGKGKEAKLAFIANALMENRNGLLMDIDLRICSGSAERDGALDMLERAGVLDGCTVGADKGYYTREFIDRCELLGVEPHVASRENGTLLKESITTSAGYAVSQIKRKLVEEIFGWFKTIGGLRKTRYVGAERVGLHALFVGASYNLLRIAKLEASCA